jgi:hypothetical protein
MAKMAVKFSRDMRISVVDNEMNDNKNAIIILSDALSNKNELKHRIDSMQRKLDTLNSQVPDLIILDSSDPDYKHIKDSTKWDIVLGLYNDGNSRAYKVKFTYREIIKLRKSADPSIEYVLLPEENAFVRRSVEVPPNRYTANTLMSFSRLICRDTSYFILNVDYYSTTNRHYNINQFFLYISSTGKFNEYLAASEDQKLYDLLIKNAYNDY